MGRVGFPRLGGRIRPVTRSGGRVLAAEIYQLADLNFLLDGTVSFLLTFDDEPEPMAIRAMEGEELFVQVETLLLQIQAVR